MPHPLDPHEIDLNHAAALATARATLRRDKIAAREALSSAEHARCSAALEARLADLLQRHPPDVLGFCWPYRSEFDCRPLVTQLLTTGTRACLPLVKAAGSAMDFREWQPDSIMAVDRYGIHFPASGTALTPDTLLIPVNAFDGKGFRIGYGLGYFDRTLAGMVPRPLSIGVGFALARVVSIHPQAHDIPLDAVVTEAGIELFTDRASSRSMLSAKADPSIEVDKL